MPIQRYRMTYNRDGQKIMIPDEGGSIVLHSDHEAEINKLTAEIGFLRWRDARLVALLKETSECRFPDCPADCPECPASRSIDLDRAEYAYLSERDTKSHKDEK